MKLVILTLVFCFSTLGAISDEVNPPVFFMGKVNGKNVSLMIQPEGSLAKLQKLEGTRLINVEPGCIMVEAYCEFLEKGQLWIKLPHDAYFSRQTKKVLGIEGSEFLIRFDPTDVPRRASKILSVTPIKIPKKDQSDAVER